jgi:hypothetical protein
MRSFVFVVLAFAAGCGGNVVVDTAGGSGGAGGAASSSTGHSTTHNASVGPSVTSSSNVSVVASSTGSIITGPAQPDCSDYGFNGIGSSCSQQEGFTCRVPYACCGGTATCNSEGVWIADAQTCNEACVPCTNGFGCEVGTVCGVDQTFTANQNTYQCFANPCSGPLDCNCAASICKHNFLSCEATQNDKVICGCPNCAGG